MNKLTINCDLWAAPHFDFRDMKEDQPMSPSGFTILSKDCDVEYWNGIGYTRIGDAVITVERPATKNDIIRSQVAAMREMAQRERADGEQKARRIEQRINELLALENQA